MAKKNREFNRVQSSGLGYRIGASSFGADECRHWVKANVQFWREVEKFTVKSFGSSPTWELQQTQIERRKFLISSLFNGVNTSDGTPKKTGLDHLIRKWDNVIGFISEVID
jgi:hypothetical protein